MSHDAMPPGPRASRRAGTPHQGRKKDRKRRRGLKITLGIVLVLLLAAGGTLYWMYSQLDGNIKGVDINKALGDDRPEKLPTSGQNLLVLGSDSRAGAENKELGAAAASAAPGPTPRWWCTYPRAGRRPSPCQFRATPSSPGPSAPRPTVRRRRPRTA